MVKWDQDLMFPGTFTNARQIQLNAVKVVCLNLVRINRKKKSYNDVKDLKIC